MQGRNLVAAWLGAGLALVYLLSFSSPFGGSNPFTEMGLLISILGLIAALSANLRRVWLERGLCFALGCSCTMLTVCFTTYPIGFGAGLLRGIRQKGSNSTCIRLSGSDVSDATANIPSPRLRAEKEPLEQ
jgi:hypothetical protein